MNYEMDLTIEAVTGTVYDLCVSPFETILGIKTKIQKLEGIPVSQQHLIHGTTELMDDYCLEEYHIESGAQLKLVIAMRGGPIHAHRIQLEDFALMELAEYLESQSPDDQDQYAIMFLSEENETRSQLHSPIEVSDSCVRGSQTSLVATTKPNTKVFSNFENDITYGKMREIQSRLKNLRLNRPEHVLVSKPKSRPTTDMLFQERSPSHFSSSHTPYTPPSATCCCDCHKKKCYCHCHYSQRCLRFTPLNDSRSTPNEVYDKQRSSRKSHEKRRRVDATCTTYGSSMWSPSIKTKHHNIHHRNVRGYQSTTVTTSGGSGSSKPQSRHDHFLPPINCIPKPKHPSPPKRESSQLESLPPIVVPKPSLVEKSKISNRCLQCHKRMRLANSFTCKCGGMYCAVHRYAESHSCTFNYKEEGKQTIARNNPLVTAPKLSKI